MTELTNQKNCLPSSETCFLVQSSQIQENRSSVLSTEELNNSMNTTASSSENTKEPVLKTSLIEFLEEFKSLPAPVIRTLFAKIVQEVSKLHLSGNYHGNLSLENIYFDQEYNVSLGQNAHASDTFLDGVCVDLICSGEVLFALCFGSLPYASLEDERYQAILNEDWELFWSVNEEALRLEKRGLNLVKSGLKDLISTFLAGQSQSKHGLAELLSHEWMKGVTMTAGQVKSLLVEVRKKMLKAI